MDRPTANWAVLNNLAENRKRDQLPQVEDIGICSLHIVSGAFQIRIKAIRWNLDKIIKAMWQLFHDSPIRKDTYIRFNLCETFPKRFCPKQWIENEEVFSRAIEIRGNVKRVIEEFESLVRSKRPKNQSYETLLQDCKDPTVVIKFQFFQDLVNKLEVFLKDFQTDHQMLPFLNDLFGNLACRLLLMFIKSKIIEDAVTDYDLTKIGLQKKENCIGLEKVCLFLVYSSIVTHFVCTS